MEVTTAMLADAAEVAAGKLFVLGGAFDTIQTRSIPTVHRSLALVLVAEIGPGERQRDLPISIALESEDGQSAGVEARGTVRAGAPAQLRPGDVSVVPLVIPFHDIPLSEAKGYAFVVQHAGTEVARVRFRVSVVQ